MYQAGRRIISHHKRHVVLGWLLIMLIALVLTGIAAAKHFLKADTAISQAPKPAVSTVIARGSATKQFDEGIFTLSLPNDWKFTGRARTIYRQYTWENTADNPGVRTLDIYVDNIPTDLGVNRSLPVEAAGDRLTATTVSDNCASFTGDKVPGSPVTPAKWMGIDFLCDLANYERNVIGTSSPGAINSVTLTGQTAGTQKLFFTYTDNSAEPDYEIFTNAL